MKVIVYTTSGKQGRLLRTVSRVVAFGALGFLLASFHSALYGDPLTFGVTVAAAAVANEAGSLCQQSSATFASCNVSGAMATANVTSGTGGYATVSLGSNATGGAAIVEFYFGIEGPSNVNVPIIISGSASTQDNAAEYGASYAAYYIYTGSLTGATSLEQFFASPNACSVLTSENFPCMSSGSFNLDASVESDTVFFVFLEAAAGGVDASATIDPLITIDPTFPLASEFTLVASPGVLPAPPTVVPEPGSLALLGVAGLGALLLQKRIRG